MPGFDRKGPLGTGPIGRGMGPCGAGQGGWFRGRGFRRGGAGWGWGYTPEPLSPSEEKEYLEQRKGWLESEIASISEKLQGIIKE